MKSDNGESVNIKKTRGFVDFSRYAKKMWVITCFSFDTHTVSSFGRVLENCPSFVHQEC